jgi:Lon protease-like protein
MTIRDLEILPSIIPIFPLRGAVLLPHAQLPLPVSEYDLNVIINPAIRKYGVIGIVQPKNDGYDLFSVGSVGRVSEIKELENDRYLCVLTGLSRFHIVEELDIEDDYRCAIVNYDLFEKDVRSDLSEETIFDHDRLTDALRKYFKALDININWSEISKTPDQKLVTTLTMICPLEAIERQAILELPGLKEQSLMITKLLEIGSHEIQGFSSLCH